MEKRAIKLTSTLFAIVVASFSSACSVGAVAAPSHLNSAPAHTQPAAKHNADPPLGLTVQQALRRYGPDAHKWLHARFKTLDVNYPPATITLVGLKRERLLLVLTGGVSPKLIRAYPLVSFSGVLGPKLREGDLQIPEGIYRITGLQASFRLALGVNYPNKFDRTNAATEKRTNLGSAILVHGGVLSTGCLVVSNQDMAQVFTLVNDVGCANTKLIIAPCNLLKEKPEIDFAKQPKWLPALYADITKALQKAGLATYSLDHAGIEPASKLLSEARQTGAY